MFLDMGKFLIRQSFGLVYDLLGYPDLSYIVEKADLIQLFLLFGRLAHTPSDLGGICGNSFGVAFCIVVLGIDRMRQGDHHLHGQSFCPV